MDKEIIGKQFDEERALYHLCHAKVTDCVFAGEADGESVLKETEDIHLSGCSFSLRYPLWHTKGFTMKDSCMDELTRAAIWYASDGEIHGCRLHGIKAVRECRHISVSDSDNVSPEFGWKSTDISLKDTSVVSEYLFLDAAQIRLERVKMSGKYSFQYVDGLEITDSVLDTKDAFWHSRNVTVKNSTVKGEYLGWFSEGLTLTGCHIIGTQPLCYCKNLTLIDCTMEDCDLSFEYSETEAQILGHIDSVKNPKSGHITADSIGEIIREDAVMECDCRILIRNA